MYNINTELLNNMLSDFSCSKEESIENFVRENAINAEKSGTCISYFIIDEDKSTSNTICVLGYYGVSLKSLKIQKDTNVSGRLQRKLKLKKESDRIVPAYLIAQLAKNDKFKNDISGDEILNHALDTVLTAIKCVGGNLVWVEANRERKNVMDFYSRNGFKEIQSETRDGIEFSQLFKLIKPSEHQ